jgi:hypothetical protein
MKLISLDVETYYDAEYSLRKMTPVEYILDPRFECIGWAVYEPGQERRFMEADEFFDYISRLPEKVTVLSHNALFDMCVLAWRFGYTPWKMVDTLGMARAMLQARLKSLSLKSVAEYLELGVKGETVHKVSGMNKQAIKFAGLFEEYGEYSCNDAELCFNIFVELMKRGFPRSELDIMDLVLRCAVNPRFILDQNLLHEHLHETKESKQTLLQKVGLFSKDDLMSNERFANALRSLGVEPPLKISRATGKETYAFAKTDPAMAELEEHENEDVQALVAARLGVKSTIEETRTERFIKISQLEWPGIGYPGRMPIPLRYSGAHTHRLSGDWKLNLQNLTRGGKLRRSLKAPPRYKVVAPDAAQIEARMTAWFCGAEELRQAFEDERDIYSEFAQDEIYHRPVNKKDHPKERFVGKQTILGAGFGVGGSKFMLMIHTLSRLQLGEKMDMTEVEAKNIITAYRRKYHAIPTMWKYLASWLPSMSTNWDLSVPVGPPGCGVSLTYQGIQLPNGMRIDYPGLEFDTATQGWRYWSAGKPIYLHGGKILENIIQALARIVVMHAAVRVRDTGLEILPKIRPHFENTFQLALKDDVFQFAMQVHDELVYIVPEPLAKFVNQLVEQEIGRRPTWAPTLPLKAEGAIGDNYGEAK